MTIYIGGTKCKLYTNGVMYNINIPTSITDGVKLMTSDNYILVDSQMSYITTTKYIDALSLDSSIL